MQTKRAAAFRWGWFLLSNERRWTKTAGNCLVRYYRWSGKVLFSQGLQDQSQWLMWCFVLLFCKASNRWRALHSFSWNIYGPKIVTFTSKMNRVLVSNTWKSIRYVKRVSFNSRLTATNSVFLRFSAISYINKFTFSVFGKHE